MALPKEPRQKMINIMYLVLTAILALNVSSEILNAFKTMDESFNNSNAGLKSRSEKLIADFDKDAKEKFPDKVAIWKPRAEKIRDISNELYSHIEKLKADLKKEAGQKVPNGEFKEDDLEATTRLFLNETKDEKKVKQLTKGEELYNLLSKYKEDLKKIDPSIAQQIKTNFPDYLKIPTLYNKDVEEQFKKMTPSQQWANIYFHMTPSIAALAILSKFQNDIRNNEAFLIEYCYSSVYSVFMPLPSFDVVAGTSSSIVKVNDEVVITAGLGAYNKDSKPVISIDGANVPLGPDGQAVYKLIASSPGEYTKRVTISYVDPATGKTETKSKDVKYSVGTSSGLAVSFDYTRVFYEGIENQLTINSGADAGKIKISFTGGINANKVRDGVFQIVPPTGSAGTTTTMTVTDGKLTTTQNIKIKAVPDPLVQVGGKSYGTISKATLAGFTGAFTKMTDFIYDGPKDYTQSVASFAVVFSGAGYPTPVGIQNNSPYFNEAVLAQFKNCQSGTSILIGNISVSKPGGGTKQIEKSVSFLIK
jgi:gliding motility-associated protein GldM